MKTSRLHKITYLLLLLSLFLIQCKSKTDTSSIEKPNTENHLDNKLDSSSIQKLHFKIDIDAPIEKVYQVITDSISFSDWTSLFGVPSFYKGSWEKGSKMIFIADMEDGSQMGMVSRIVEHIPNQLISIEHLGSYLNGEETMEGEEVDAFKGSLETYKLSYDGKTTTMSVETDVFITPDDFYNETWPKALNRIKELSEN